MAPAEVEQIPRRSSPPLAVGPDEAAKMCGLGRTTLYAQIKSGDLPSFKIGTRRLITVDTLRAWLGRKELSAG